MDNQSNAINALVEKAGDYAKIRAELLKLKVVQTSSEVGSSVLSGVVLLLLVNLCLFFLSMGLAIWIGNYTGNAFYGFFAAGGFYLLLCMLVVIFRKKWLKQPLQNLLIKKING